MKYLKRCLVFLALTTFVVGCAPPSYSEAELAGLQSQSVSGIIIEQSKGSFVLRDAKGNETLFRTGQLTQYIPELYRSQLSDEVRVAYKEIWESSAQPKRAVLQLEALHIPEQNLLPENPVTGVVTSIQKGSSRYIKSIVLKTDQSANGLLIYLKQSDETLKIDGKSIAIENFEFKDLVSRRVEVDLTREPILRGNAYVLVAKSLTCSTK